MQVKANQNSWKMFMYIFKSNCFSKMFKTTYYNKRENTNYTCISKLFTFKILFYINIKLSVFYYMSILCFTNIIKCWYSMLNSCEGKELGSWFMCATSRPIYI